MLGGGIFTSMNKVLNGSYINYVSASTATAQLSDRGTGALPISLNWGANAVVKMENADFEKDCINVFGYAFDTEEMLPFREFFKHGKTLLVYNLSNGEKATCSLSTAKYCGIRGNDIKHVVAKNVDDTSKFDVSTYVGTYLADTQTVSSASELVDNDFVLFKHEAELSVSAGINLVGGTNGEVTGADHQKALDLLENYTFSTLGCMSNDEVTKNLYSAYTKRLRDDIGIKFQLVSYNNSADYIGVINVKNKVNDEGADVFSLIPWVLGAEAGCALNATVENMKYDGEYDIDVAYKQSDLVSAIKAGEFMFHQNGEDVCVLSDINSFVSFTKEMTEDFSINQVVRVVDEVALQQASIFNTQYVGKVNNIADGRSSFWSDCVSVCNELQRINALENFDSSDIVVEKGAGKRDVVVTFAIQPVCSMGKLYSTIYVS